MTYTLDNVLDQINTAGLHKHVVSRQLEILLGTEAPVAALVCTGFAMDAARGVGNLLNATILTDTRLLVVDLEEEHQPDRPPALRTVVRMHDLRSIVEVRTAIHVDRPADPDAPAVNRLMVEILTNELDSIDLRADLLEALDDPDGLDLSPEEQDFALNQPPGLTAAVGLSGAFDNFALEYGADDAVTDQPSAADLLAFTAAVSLAVSRR